MSADPFANIPNADDSLNGEFSPASRPQQPSIIEPVDQAGYYLRQANDAGLPLPSYVTVSAHHSGSHIGIQLASDEQVRQWARHFGAEAVLTKSGISAAIGDANRHEVSAYHMFPKAAEPVPDLADALKRSLAEHTQAACDTITKASQ